MKAANDAFDDENKPKEESSFLGQKINPNAVKENFIYRQDGPELQVFLEENLQKTLE
jgi:hypothetical protein